MAAPSIAPSLSVEEYLGGSFSPDQDYIDGHLEERNLGEYDHGRTQTLLAMWFFAREQELAVRVVTEQRVQVSGSRFRVPDVCVLRRRSFIEQIVKEPPLICIEVLSPSDSIQSMRERVTDYLGMGVEHVWLLDPLTREGLICTFSGWNQPANGELTIEGTEIRIPLAEIFAGLDA